jgi:hypothetical protein
VVERDLLGSPSGVAVADRARDIFTGTLAPNETILQSILFDGTRATREFKQTFIRYEYGSCVRPPYGHLPMASMSKADAAKLYIKSDPTATDDFWVGENALVGYCELFNEMPTFCLNDPMSNAMRRQFCHPAISQQIVIGSAVKDRAFDDICSAATKTCWVIPGTPSFPTIGSVLDGVFSPAGTLTNYTIMIAPFNWTDVAANVMGPKRGYYMVGGDPLNEKTHKRIGRLDDDDVDSYGMRAVSAATFAALAHNTHTVEELQTATADIVNMLETRMPNPIKSMSDPYVGNTAAYPLSAIGAPHTEAGIRIVHNGLTVISSSATIPLRFARSANQFTSSAPCTQFLVQASRFNLPYVEASQQGCSRTTELDRAVVVFGGADCSDSAVYVNVTYAPLAVAFLGDDTLSFHQTSETLIGTSNITVEMDSASRIFAVGAARASGTLRVNASGAYYAPLLFQPLRGEKLAAQCYNPRAVAWGPCANITQVSDYTDVFGDAYMKNVFSERDTNVQSMGRIVLVLALLGAAVVGTGLICIEIF